MPRFETPTTRKPKEKAPVIAGIGESRTFNNPDPAEQLDPLRSIRGCHVGGKPVEELPEDVAHLLTYDHTDEGIEARNAERQESAARVTDPLDKQIEGRARATEPWEAPDPMGDLVKEHVKPGERARFLSGPVCDLKGTRGFELVKDEYGREVRLGRLMLGVMPEDRAKQREKHYQRITRELETEKATEYQEQHERFVREARKQGIRVDDIRPLSPGEAIEGTNAAGYGVSSRHSGRERIDAPEGSQIGLRSVRGNVRELEE